MAQTQTAVTVDDYFAACAAAQLVHPSWRYGQTLANVLNGMRPDLSGQVRGTEMDPFYGRGAHRLSPFLAWVQEHWDD